jgi:hypothetical protein
MTRRDKLRFSMLKNAERNNISRTMQILNSELQEIGNNESSCNILEDSNYF